MSAVKSPPGKRRCQRFGGKQMAAGAASGNDHERRLVNVGHQLALPTGTGSAGAVISSARGCSRDSARSMPMP